MLTAESFKETTEQAAAEFKRLEDEITRLNGIIHTERNRVQAIVTAEALASGKRAALGCIGIIRDSSDRHIVIATIKERYGLE